MSSRNRIPFRFHCFPRSRGVRSWLPWKKAAGCWLAGRAAFAAAGGRAVCVGVSAGQASGPAAATTHCTPGCGRVVAGSPAEAAVHAGSPCTPRAGGLVRAGSRPRSVPGSLPAPARGVSCLQPACCARLALHLHLPPPPSPSPHFILCPPSTLRPLVLSTPSLPLALLSLSLI